MLRYCIQDAIFFRLRSSVFRQFKNYTIHQVAPHVRRVNLQQVHQLMRMSMCVISQFQIMKRTAVVTQPLNGAGKLFIIGVCIRFSV